jgi:hypothetical protein
MLTFDTPGTHENFGVFDDEEFGSEYSDDNDCDIGWSDSEVFDLFNPLNSPSAEYDKVGSGYN